MLKFRYKAGAAAVLVVFAGFFLAMKSSSYRAQSLTPTDNIQRGQLSADLKPFDLPALVKSADKIYRGTLVSSKPGTVEAGGGQLSVVTYRFKVEDSFQGTFDSVKDISFAEITMLGKAKSRTGGAAQATKFLPEMPTFVEGETYLIFATKPSAVGLSVTVGLGQGSFKIGMQDKREVALNQFNNRNLSAAPQTDRSQRSAAAADERSGGPVAYDDLAERIRSEVTRLGRSN